MQTTAVLPLAKAMQIASPAAKKSMAASAFLAKAPGAKNVRRLVLDPLSEPLILDTAPWAVVRRGTLDDIRWLLPIIKREIPEKKYIREGEIRSRCAGGCSIAVAESLSGAKIGGAIALHNGCEFYLWLGAFSEKGAGIGAAATKALLKEAFCLGFEAVTVKTGAGNAPARSLLRKLGFSAVNSCSGLLEFYLPLEINMANNTFPYTPKSVQQAVDGIAASQLCEYREDFEQIARERIAQASGVHIQNVRLSASGDDSIRLALELARREKIVVQSPTYSVIEQAAREVGRLELIEEGALLGSKAGAFEGKVVFLCNPNNPTGRLLNPQDVRRIAEASRLTIVDEAYMHFAGKSAEGMVAKLPLIVMKTISKLGSTVAQLGIILSRPDILARLPKISQPSAIGCAVAARLFSSEGQKETEGIVRRINSERERMCGRLSGRFGILSDQNANFLLLDADEGMAVRLEAIGIRVRRAKIRGKQCIRITVRSDWENDLLLQAIEEMQ